MTKFLNISTDNTLGGNSPSDVLVSSQKAIKEYVDAHGGGGSVAIDDSTITKNSSDEIQAVATVNANTVSGSTNPLYDWVGTESEYRAQNIEINHPDWLCFITDDCANTESFVVQKDVTERNIGEIIYSLVPVTDGGLHLLDGTLIDGTGIYKDFYDHMVDVYNNGHTSIFCSESDWQTANTTNGKCGKFVLNTTNSTIRLPHISGYLTITEAESTIGNFVAAGLPNITGTFRGRNNYNDAVLEATGAFGTESRSSASGASGAGNNAYAFSFNASSSNPIYGRSDTVTPESIKVFAYIVIANTQKTPVQVDIDNIATELNACYSHRVVEFQAPTSSNNYTWYRKYADGWVEQGGLFDAPNNTAGVEKTVTLPISMTNDKYTTTIGVHNTTNDTAVYLFVASKTTTTITFKCNIANASLADQNWQVSGMAAS